MQRQMMWAFPTMSGSLLTSTLLQDPPRGLMRAPFILQVFANHLNSIVGAEDIPEIEIAEGVSVVAKYPPIGGLALAAAAVSAFLDT